MKRFFLRGLLVLGIAALIVFGIFYYQANHGFTPWMDDEAFHQWRTTSLDHQPVYMTAIEGRIANGQLTWRARMEPKPQHAKWSWKWFSQLDENTYQDFSNRIINQEGYRRIWTQSYKDSAGEPRYQVIFLHIQSAE